MASNSKRQNVIKSGWRDRLGLWGCIAAAGGAIWIATGFSVRGSYLFTDFLNPWLDGLNTDYSAWNYTSTGNLGEYPFYAANGAPNFPTSAAPYGDWTPASVAGVSNPGAGSWTSANPSAFWDSRNPRIIQNGAPAFVTSSGGIYSYQGPTSFTLQGATPYNLGTVVFQFQTEGTTVDFSSILLKYTDATGSHTVAPNEWIQEFSGSASSFGGLTNRVALQWSLGGLNISSYQIVFIAEGSSMSLQQVLLDTASNYAAVVPSSGKWTGASGNWSNTSMWAQNTTNHNYLPQENGNVTFANSGSSTVTLDAGHSVGELTFDTPYSATIASTGGAAITSNTGIATTTQATGEYDINAPFVLNALNLFHINAGSVVMNGPISGSYGLVKDGNGTLTLAANNTFSGGLEIEAGTVRVSGANTYGGATVVLFGNLVVAADAGATGALGSSTSTISLGADSSLYEFLGGTGAGIVIDGDHTISRPIAMENGSFEKVLGTQHTAGGATFSGAIALGTATNVHLNAAAATDILSFSGGMSGGATNGQVVIDGQGTVVFTGNGRQYSYGLTTNVASGILRIDQGAAVSGSGNVSVNGGQLIVRGTIGGSGSVSVNSGTLSGDGTINRQITVSSGGRLSPGFGIGSIATQAETWAGGSTLHIELTNANGTHGSGWDQINITGGLDLQATGANRVKIELATVTSSGALGLLSSFDPQASYTWQFVSTSTGITGFDPSKFTIDASAFRGAAGDFSVGMNGNSLVLQYVAVPEPCAASLILGGTLTAFYRRRRRF